MSNGNRVVDNTFDDSVAVPRRTAKIAYRALRQRWVWYPKHGHAVPRDLDEALRAVAEAIGVDPPPPPFHGISDRPWKE